MKKNEMTKKLMEEFNEDFIDVGGVLDTTLPDPTMVEYYRRLKKREILWNDDISDATIDIALYIKKWNAEDKIGMGRVYSAGGLLLMAGHKRYVFPHTSCLIHDGSSGAIGSIGKMLDNLEFTKELEKRMKEYILSSTRITEEVYDQNYRRDWFLFSEEMIVLGIADEIVTDIDIILG